MPHPFTMDRRTFCRVVVGGPLAASAACARPDAESPEAGLIRLLALGPAERPWLRSLTAAEQQELYTALVASRDRRSRRTVDLLMKVVGRRERLFAYVGYPPLPNRLSACDGLIRE